MLPALLGSRCYSKKEQWSAKATTLDSLCNAPCLTGDEQLGLCRHGKIVSGKGFEFFREICFKNTIIITAVIKAEPWFQLMPFWRQWVGSNPISHPSRGTQHPPCFPPCAVSQPYCFQFPRFLKDLTLPASHKRSVPREGDNWEGNLPRTNQSSNFSKKIAEFSPC